MTFAPRDAILQPGPDSPPGPRPADAWPAWTDGIRFGLGPSALGLAPWPVPEDPTVRRTSYRLGGLEVAVDVVVARPLAWATWDGRQGGGWTVEPFADRVVAWRALDAVEVPACRPATPRAPSAPGRLTVAWRELVEARRSGMRHAGSGGTTWEERCRQDDLFDRDQDRLAALNGRLAALIAEEAREDLDAIGPDDWRLGVPEEPVAMVREGVLVFALFLVEHGSHLAGGCEPLANAPRHTVRPVVLASPPAAFLAP